MIPNYTLIYTSGEGGYLTGDTIQTVEEEEQGSAVQALAAVGYQFVSWSDGRTDNPRIDSVVIGDIQVQAIFEIITGLKWNEVQSLQAFPNPTQSMLNIKMEKSGRLQYHLFRSNGQFVSQGILLNEPLDVSQFQPGIYFLQFIDEQGNVAYVKFVKE